MAVCGDNPLALPFPCFPRRMNSDPNIGIKKVHAAAQAGLTAVESTTAVHGYYLFSVCGDIYL